MYCNSYHAASPSYNKTFKQSYPHRFDMTILMVSLVDTKNAVYGYVNGIIYFSFV